jgi:hypothetical protein
MPKKRQKRDFAPHIPPETAPCCHAEGCVLAGIYKAPKSRGQDMSREQTENYNWFCLQHIREHNQKWDYFSGMESDEIEDFISDSVTGHRPTWSREERMRLHANTATLHDKLYEFVSGKKSTPQKPRLPAKLQKSLIVMGMEYPYNLTELKAKYRILVKKHHPDLNRGDKEHEEKFKQITTAYKYLLEYRH